MRWSYNLALWGFWSAVAGLTLVSWYIVHFRWLLMWALVTALDVWVLEYLI